jgi:riboflavin biosynthesis pyrimidine reductase
VRQIFPATAGGPQIVLAEPGQASPATLDVLAGLYAYPEDAARAARPWVRANMVASADGAAWLAGRAGGLSGRADRLVFSVLRSLADVILVGAGTARAERYRPVRDTEAFPRLREGRPATPPIAVVSRALDLDPDGPLLAAQPGRARTIVLTTEAAAPDRRAAAARHADVIVAGEDLVTGAGAIRALASRGFTRILAEGGPTLLGFIAAGRLLDELCLTYSPMLVGGDVGRIVSAPVGQGGQGAPAALAGLSLAHVLEDDGHLLCRYLSVPAG